MTVAVAMDTLAMTTAVTWTGQVVNTEDGRHFSCARVPYGAQFAAKTQMLEYLSSEYLCVTDDYYIARYCNKYLNNNNSTMCAIRDPS